MPQIYVRYAYGNSLHEKRHVNYLIDTANLFFKNEIQAKRTGSFTPTERKITIFFFKMEVKSGDNKVVVIKFKKFLGRFFTRY